MKTLIALLLTLFSLTFAAEEPQKDDPIVGVWRGFKSKRVIEILPDGTFVELPDGKKKKGEVVGRWKPVESKSVERKYQLIWFSGQHVHNMTMNRAGDKISGTNQVGANQEAVRINIDP